MKGSSNHDVTTCETIHVLVLEFVVSVVAAR